MQKIVKYKVKNGKLLEIRVIYDEKIQDLKILGDFFIYPDEGLEIIEKELIGVKLDLNSIEEKINHTVKKNNIEMIGIDPRSIAISICEAET